MRKKLAIVLAGVALGWAAPVYAVNTTCANAEPFIIGSQTSYALPASGSLYFKTYLTANRSYVLWAYPPYEDASEGLTGISLSLYTSTTCTTPATGTSVVEREPLGNITGADVDQLSVRPSTSGTYVLQIANGVANAYTVHLVGLETTIFSPWWFTGGANQAFVTMKNNMDLSTSITLHIYATSGAECGTETFTLNANANTYRRVNDYPACVTAGFGGASIAFWGPPHGIVANTTVIDAVQGVSFDEPFTPRMVWSITNR